MTENPSRQPSLTRHLQFGPYEVDLNTQEFWKHGTRVKLAGQPFQVLAMLISRPGELVTREELQEELWPEDTFADSNHGLNAAVNKLRETLHDTASDPRYIETLPRRGYRFIGLVSPGTPEPATPMAIPSSAAVPNPVPPALIAPPTRRRFDNSQLLAASGPVLLVVVGVVMFLSPGRDRLRTPIPQSPGIMAITAPPTLALQVPEQSVTPNPRTAVQSAGHNNYSAPPAVFREASTSSLPAVRTIISGDGGNAAPQFSPDGRRIAFMSNRSGPWQIWVSNADGSHPVQLSYTESAGTPRWSPDGRLIAFDAPSDEGTSIFLIPSDGSGSARELIPGQVPSFSRDGRWVYFASDRFGGLQVWKAPVTGGAAQQVTMNGGFAALESNDGYIYYTKSPGAKPEICRIAVSGGNETCTFSHLRPRTWSSWAVTRNGILFAEDLPGGRSALSVYEPAKQQVRDLLWLPSPPVWMGARPDGKEAIVNDISESRISVVENLR